MKKPDRHYFFTPSSGSRLFVQEWGATDKPVLLFFHGFPGSAEHAQLMTTYPRHDRLRMIAMDRPGYGKSDRQKNLTPIAFARQILELLEHLEIRDLRILYVSGGAPYALAVAHLLGPRVLRISSVSGIAPVSASNFRYLNAKQKKAWFTQKLVPASILDQFLALALRGNLENLDELIFANLDSYSPADRLVFNDPVIGSFLTQSFQYSLSQGVGGVVDDILVYGKAWGFPLEKVNRPITFWHGDADDVVHVEIAHDMKRKFPQSVLHIAPNEGHYSVAKNYRDQIMDDLLEGDSSSQESN